MTFQFGSEFEANQRVDPLFQRAMDTLMGRTPALVAECAAPAPRSRYETRLAGIKSR
jgi:hypothetical protein